MRCFADRASAGRELAERLSAYHTARRPHPRRLDTLRPHRASASRALCSQLARPQPCNADGAPTETTLVVAPPPPHRRHPPWPHEATAPASACPRAQRVTAVARCRLQSLGRATRWPAPLQSAE